MFKKHIKNYQSFSSAYKEINLPIKTMAKLIVFVVGLLLFFSMATYTRNYFAENKTEQLAKSVADMTSKINKSGKKIYGVLNSRLSAQRVGFSPELEYLSSFHIEGLWVTKMNISLITGTVTIEGSSVSSDDVHALLYRLEEKDSPLYGWNFKMHELSALKIQSSAPAAGKEAQLAETDDFYRFTIIASKELSIDQAT